MNLERFSNALRSSAAIVAISESGKRLQNSFSSIFSFMAKPSNETAVFGNNADSFADALVK